MPNNKSMDQMLGLCREPVDELVSFILQTQDEKWFNAAVRIIDGRPVEAREEYFMQKAQEYIHADYKTAFEEILAWDRLGFFRDCFLADSVFKDIPINQPVLEYEMNRLSSLKEL